MNPEWKRHQKAFYLEERKQIVKAMENADKTRRVKLQKRLRALRSPRYRIRQILLKEGSRADRCVTCHLDLKQLEGKHPEIDRFPFEEYGCTVCHGGVGRATEKAMAHSTKRIPPRPLYEYLQARGNKTYPLDLFRYSASGEPIHYTGSKLCLRCHLSSHPRHVARWRKLKFKPLDEVQNKLKEVRGNGVALDESRCFSCHTTAFNKGTGGFLEDRVTCESCHGPGGFYADLMAGGRARDGAELARANILETRSDRVCLNCHTPNRHSDYEGEDRPPWLIAARLSGKPAPEMDGKILDEVWGTALETKISTWRLEDASPQPGIEIFARAVYSDTHIYFAFRWLDKTRNNRMGQWVYSSEGWRADVEWPDALALHWQTTMQVEDFGQGGCAVLCHTTGRFKEFPRMATGQEGALVDEWTWNAFTAKKGGRPGDGFLDHQIKFLPKGSPKPPLRWTHPERSAAHGSDASGARMPETLGGFPLILNAKVADGESKEKILPLYETGTPEGGDSADIQGKASWSDGYWTLELSRPLRTPGNRDVQFDLSQKSTSFGLAVWDGAAGDQHQVATIVKLRFETAPEVK